ncbi:glucose-6-phosphate dehydrogenase assembly protein OpcA [Microbacterium betulae]|uniref:Glucose-6-phosphate dehydrogenase assembly protein OpcA n=1 Tax=Microbacterium betulae TaxID=2981139 RepID=A0AA97FHT2_9MICO|nr:glucose-6-phosphate dehydrogenase assembly protein OpcA [Microbacterium sp. AB]WOF22329.1 glucose-6-phosphate dehydrogenase assembly protein OpcA [Microbacterium sp. AB]
MIITLDHTTTGEVARRLVRTREEGGAPGLAHVLTLIVSLPSRVDEDIVDTANVVSYEHPMRVIVVVTDPDGDARLDAEIRVGGDAGASEVVILRAYGDATENEISLVTGLLLPDAPVVTWWPHDAPSAPAQAPLGRIAQRRITHSLTSAPIERYAYTPGDTDLAWARLTRWRDQLAAILDQRPGHAVTAVEVTGDPEGSSSNLLTAWLGAALAAPAHLVEHDAQHERIDDDGVHSVRLRHADGDIVLARTSDRFADLSWPGRRTQRLLLPSASLRDKLSEELRQLDPDDVFGSALGAFQAARPGAAVSLPTPPEDDDV